MSRLLVFHLLTHLIDNIYFQLYKCVVCTMKRERNWSVGNYVEISSASGEGLELEVTCSFFIVRFFYQDERITMSFYYSVDSFFMQSLTSILLSYRDKKFDFASWHNCTVLSNRLIDF